MEYDLGSKVPLGTTITDATGLPADADSVTINIYQPDGTMVNGTVVHYATGVYNCDFIPTLVGRYVVRWLATGANQGAIEDEFQVRDINMIGVASLDLVRTHLNLVSTKNDTELRRFMGAATAQAERYMNRVIGRRTFTELYDGNCFAIYTRHGTILSLVSVSENGTVNDPSLYLIDEYGFSIERVDQQTFLGLRLGVSVTYVAGFAAPPEDIVQGVLEFIRHLWDTQRGPVSVMPADANEGYVTGAGYSIPHRVAEFFDNWRLPSTN